MRKLIYFGLIAALSVSCHKNDVADKTPCNLSGACTQEFRTVGVRFLDKQGNLLGAVTDFTVFDKHTNKKLTVTPIPTPLGYFIVATDGNMQDLSTEGDEIEVSATHPQTKETISAIFKIAGGCACHISKLSGPEQMSFTK